MTKSIAGAVFIGFLIGIMVAVLATPKVSPFLGDQLGVRLVGTSVELNGIAYAIFENVETGDQEVLGINDSLFGRAKLLGIGKDRVTLLVDGTEYAMGTRSGRGNGAPTSGENGSVGPGTLFGRELALVQDSEDAVVSEITMADGKPVLHISKERLEARWSEFPKAVFSSIPLPEMKDGEVVGVKFFRVKDDNLLAKLGIRDGDVVKEINGASVTDPYSAMKEVDSSGGSVGLTIERGGHELRYDLVVGG